MLANGTWCTPGHAAHRQACEAAGVWGVTREPPLLCGGRGASARPAAAGNWPALVLQLPESHTPCHTAQQPAFQKMSSQRSGQTSSSVLPTRPTSQPDPPPRHTAHAPALLLGRSRWLPPSPAQTSFSSFPRKDAFILPFLKGLEVEFLLLSRLITV